MNEEQEMLAYEMACEIQSPNSMDFDQIVSCCLAKLGYED